METEITQIEFEDLFSSTKATELCDLVEIIRHNITLKFKASKRATFHSEDSGYLRASMFFTKIINKIKQDKALLNSMLLCSAYNGFNHLTKTLLKNGANIHIQNSLNQTPLHLATIGEHVETVKILLSAGADPLPEANLVTRSHNAYLFYVFRQHLMKSNIGTF